MKCLTMTSKALFFDSFQKRTKYAFEKQNQLNLIDYKFHTYPL